MPAITDPAGLTIEGPGADKLTISGNHAVRVLEVNEGAALILQSLTIGDGRATNCPTSFSRILCGGGIYNAGALTVQNSTLSGNSAPGDGGGIINDRGDDLAQLAAFADAVYADHWTGRKITPSA